MVSTDLIRTIVGIIGNAISLGLFLSPVPTFRRIVTKRSVEQFSPVPYLVTLLNCMSWVLYGLPMVHPHSTLVVTINGSGTAIELVYVFLFIVFSGDGKKRLRVLAGLVAEVVFVVAVGVMVMVFAHSHKERSMVVGIICVFMCTFMYAAPLAAMKLVIQTKSVEFMPLTLSLASFFNGVCWTTYALIRFDLFIVIPNSIGLVLSTAQLTLYAMYYKSTQRQMEARKRELGMSDVVVVSIDGAEHGSKVNGAAAAPHHINGRRDNNHAGF